MKWLENIELEKLVIVGLTIVCIIGAIASMFTEIFGCK